MRNRVDRDIEILTSFIRIYGDNEHSSEKSPPQSLEIRGKEVLTSVVTVKIYLNTR